jgi:peroxiredoxin
VRAALIALLVAVAAPCPIVAGAEDAPLAPTFTTRSVTGETLDLETLRAHGPVVLDFWATWCKPCLAALPELEMLRARFAGRGLTVIGISVDGPRNFPKVRPAARRLGLGFPIVLDEDGDLQRRFQVRAVPTSVLISPEGRMVRVTQGWRPGETEGLRAAIETLLADTTGTATP